MIYFRGWYTVFLLLLDFPCANESRAHNTHYALHSTGIAASQQQPATGRLRMQWNVTTVSMDDHFKHVERLGSLIARSKWPGLAQFPHSSNSSLKPPRSSRTCYLCARTRRRLVSLRQLLPHAASLIHQPSDMSDGHGRLEGVCESLLHHWHIWVIWAPSMTLK